MKKPEYKTLARYLRDGWVAYHMGVTPRTASTYFGDEDVGEFWYGVAEAVEQAMRQRPNPWLAAQPQSRVQ